MRAFTVAQLMVPKISRQFDSQPKRFFLLVPWAPACLAWPRLIKHLAPFLNWSLTGGVLGVQWKDDMLRKAVRSRYSKFKDWAHQTLFDYYNVSEDYNK